MCPCSAVPAPNKSTLRSSGVGFLPGWDHMLETSGAHAQYSKDCVSHLLRKELSAFQGVVLWGYLIKPIALSPEKCVLTQSVSYHFNKYRTLKSNNSTQTEFKTMILTLKMWNPAG